MKANGELRRGAHNKSNSSINRKSLDDLGLIAAVRSLCTQFGSRTNAEVDLKLCQLSNDLTLELEMTLYRSLQEALNNIEKHAQASKVVIRMSREDSYIVLVLKDNGKGFDTSSIGQGKPGVGLRNLKERATLVVGELNIESKQGAGTRIHLKLPIDTRKNANG